MHRSKVPYFFLALAAVLAVAAVVLLFVRLKSPAPVSETPPEPPAAEQRPAIDALQRPMPPDTADGVLDDLGIGVASVDPADLVSRIGKALEAGDLAAVEKLIGKDALDEAALSRLKEFAAGRPVRIRQPGGVREVGEIELNALTRWVLEFDDPEASRIFFDLRRKDGKWSVEKFTLPGGSKTFPAIDALSVADAFLQSVLRQDFETARSHVDPVTVSDTKIAALCILFEEGDYRLRSTKPLRAMFAREDTSGYIANVEHGGSGQTAQFSLNLRRTETAKGWLVAEVNLDQLLADYARRDAGGDAYYSPLVKNPAGGDTLALYFDFDEDHINPRTQRQIEIVARILKADPVKKITISGHTDALGTDPYNDGLSARRAETVREYLAAAGVTAEQIVTQAKGASEPRRPNVTADGADNPDGRRANRRTEIYLDF